MTSTITRPSLTLFDHPTRSPQSRWAAVLLRCFVHPLVWLLSHLVRAVAWPNFIVAVFAGLVDFGARFVLRPLPGARHTEVRLAECSARWSLPPGVTDQPERAILYLHGGAFVACGLNTHKRLANKLGQFAGAGMLLVDYGQLPYHTIDDSVRHCVAGYRWLLAQGWAPEQIVFAGDSAGGFLSFATALRAREEGLALPSGIVAMAPWVDWDMRGKLASPSAHQDCYLPAAGLSALSSLVGRSQRQTFLRGRARPVPDLFTSQLAGLPPALIHVSSSELLFPDAQKLASALTEAGVPTTLKTWAGQPHVFQGVAEWTPEATASLKELGAFIRGVAADPQPGLKQVDMAAARACR